MLFLTAGIEVVFAVFFLSFHTLLPQLYTGNTEVITIASSMLIFAAFFQISDGLQATAAGALRGMQDVTVPAVIAFVSYWCIMAPACYLLAFEFGFGLTGIWLGFIIGLTAAAVLQILRYRQKLKSVEFTEL